MQVKENLEAGKSAKQPNETPRVEEQRSAKKNTAESAPSAVASPRREKESPETQKTGERAEGFKAVPRTEIGRDRWDAFADRSPSAWFWHRYDMSDVWGEWNNRQDKSFALVNPSNSEVVAIVPTFKDSDRIAKWVAWNSLHVLGGPAFDAQLPRKLRAAIVESLSQYLQAMARQNQVHEIKFSLASMTPMIRGEECPRVNPLWEFDCENVMGQTWVCDLRSSKDELWKKLGKGAKSSVGKAQKLGVQVRIGDRNEDLDLYYRLHRETYRRTGELPHAREHFEATWKHFVSKGLSVVFVAELGGEVVGAANMAVYKKGAYYWTGGSSANGLRAGANAAIQWSAIQWMVDNGVEWYEVGEAHLGGENSKLKQISDFKKDFGGALYPLFRGTLDTKNKMRRTLALLKEFQKQVLKRH